MLKQESKYGFAKTFFPIRMHRWDEALFLSLAAQARSDMGEFLKGAEQEAEREPPDTEKDWHPYEQTVRYIEQFRGPDLVSYLQVTSTASKGGQPAMTFKTINFNKETKAAIGLGELFEGAADRSPPLDALAQYARAALKDQTGEEEESDALIELTKPDLAVYGRFTFCPSTKLGKAAGLTIHFPPEAEGPYAGSDFHITIPYTVFSRFLKPGMRNLFSGEPRQAPVDLQDTDS